MNLNKQFKSIYLAIRPGCNFSLATFKTESSYNRWMMFSANWFFPDNMLKHADENSISPNFACYSLDGEKSAWIWKTFVGKVKKFALMSSNFSTHCRNPF